MKKDNKKILRFLSDPDFKQWVINPSATQDVYWKKWLTSHPDFKAAAYQAKEIILRIKFKDESLSIDEQEEILDKVIASSTEKYKIQAISFNWHKIAATISFLIIASSAFFFFNLYAPKHKPSGFEEPVQFITKQNKRGVKSQILLPDGTKVHLNAESSLKYPAQFSQSDRQVILTGEAFFDVVNDSLRPFSVIAKNTITTALGTSFNVKAFDTENNIDVALVSGSVLFTSEHSAIDDYKLKPGEKVVVNLKEEKSHLTTFNVLTEIGWKDGLLTFRNAGFSEFVQKIERWYGVDVQIIGTPQNRWNIDGNFDNESLEEILQSVRFTHDLSFQLKNSEVKIRFD